MLDLPLDRFRNGIYNQQFRSQMVLLSPIQTEQLKLLSQQYDVTLFMTLLAALKTVLFKWSGQRDIAVGTVIAGRRYTELEPLIGCFLNFLALRTQLEPDMSWEQLVSVVKTMVLDAYTHQDLPFEKVVAELQPDRTRYHNPFYNVAFVLHNTWQRQNAFHTTGLTMELQSLPRRDALLDLRFNGVETAEGLQINCEYDASLFHDTTIHTLLEAYQQVLQQIIRDSSTALDAFSLPDRLVQQAQRARRRAQPQTLAIAATFTAEPLEAALSYWMHELQLPTKITFAAYHQVLQQLLDPQSLLATNTAGVNVILLRFEDWLRFSQSTGHGSSVRQMLEPLLDEFLQAIQQFLLRTSVSNLLCICPPSPQVQADAALNLLCQQMEQRLIQEVSQSRGITVLSSSEVLSKYTVEDYYDDYTDKAGHVPFTPRFFTALGTSIARKIAALKFQSYKVIVVDCDQTLWQGVCGEDGPQGIVIDPARRALQEFLVAQQEAGMLICLNSKNSEQDVQAVFDAHPEMPLQRHHLTALRINWLPKSQNLRALAQSLNLSLESMIFVDDNPLEQAEVQAQCPEVLIFPFPEQSAELPQRLAHFWAFDQVSRTAEDTQRTRYYQQEQQRQHFMQSTLSLADFLAHLNLQVRITSLEEQYLTRAAQLTQRTNQFNLTTIRRTEQDIRQFCHEQQGEALVIHVEDRFGAYGLVGLVLYTCTQDTLLVDTFLLSCRVLGRGVEHQIVAYLGTCAQERGLATVTLPYRPTSKNQPAADFLERSGSQFKQAQKQGWDIVFPLLIAAQLRFAPDVEPEQAQATAVATETAATKPQPSDEEHLTQAQLHHIAIHLQSVEQIYQQIQLQAPRKTVQQGMGGGKPQSAVEEGLLKIWSELLHLDTLGTEDNFFLIGGHSLLATQVLSQVRTVFQVELPLQRIFDHPTIVEMAQLIEETQRDMLGQSDDEFLAQMVMELGGVSQDDFLGLLTDIDE
jgi:FkbH-like protein